MTAGPFVIGNRFTSTSRLESPHNNSGDAEFLGLASEDPHKFGCRSPTWNCGSADLRDHVRSRFLLDKADATAKAFVQDGSDLNNNVHKLTSQARSYLLAELNSNYWQVD